jgi:hypothetical protein
MEPGEQVITAGEVHVTARHLTAPDLWDRPPLLRTRHRAPSTGPTILANILGMFSCRRDERQTFHQSATRHINPLNGTCSH